jgi:hypothetical protein
MGAAAAQGGAKEGANWERQQHKKEHKKEQIGSGGSARGSKRWSGVRIPGLVSTSPTSLSGCFDMRNSSGTPRTFLYAACG